MRTLQIRHFIELICEMPVCGAEKMVIGFTLDECERKAFKLGWVLNANWTSCLCPTCSASMKVQDNAQLRSPLH